MQGVESVSSSESVQIGKARLSGSGFCSAAAVSEPDLESVQRKWWEMNMTLFALDGTSNRLSGGGGRWTHVALMAVARGRTQSAVAPNPSGKVATTLEVESDDVLYQRGVGSGKALDKIFGGATGWGAKVRVRRAYQRICKNYAKEDASAEDLTIDIVGFSRGAATALHLANVIYMMGIRAPRRRFSSWIPYRNSVGWTWFSDWPRLSAIEVDRIRDRIAAVGLDDKQLLAHDDILVPRIRFLGLYDAVSSFVLPMDTRVIDFQSYGFGFRLHAPPNIGSCSHAMALDERRKSFRNVRVHPASMMRARTLRSEEVGRGSLAVAMVILGLWLLYAILPGSLGSAQPWSIVVFIGALAAAFSHLVRGATSDVADLVDVGERTDVKHQNKHGWAERMSSVTGVGMGEISATVGLAPEAPKNAARQTFGMDPVTKAMAPGLGALFALIALASVDMFGGFDNASISAWDYIGAVVWAFITTMALAILGPALAADSTSLRSSAEIVGLAARRLSVIGVVAAWGLATWWLVAVATGWWSHDFAEPWFWLVLLAGLCLGLAAGVASAHRPTEQLARLEQQKEPNTSGVTDDGLMVMTLATMIVLGAWIVRRAVSRAVDVTAVPWWQYVAMVVGAGLVAAVFKWRIVAHEATVPPSAGDIFEHFSHGEAREMWFRGNHTDIGGGGAPGLCDRSLRWMTAEASRAGLEIDLDTIKPELGERLVGKCPEGVGPTMDPVIARARRLILDGDLGHPSVDPSSKPVPEDPKTMVRFNRNRLLRGEDLAYDPKPKRSGLSLAIARRFKSPYKERFVGVLGRVPDPDGDHFEWALESSAGRVFAKSQQSVIDRWSGGN